MGLRNWPSKNPAFLALKLNCILDDLDISPDYLRQADILRFVLCRF